MSLFKMSLLILALLGAGWTAGKPEPHDAGTLVIQVRFVEQPGGSLRLAIYEEQGFLEEGKDIAGKAIKTTDRQDYEVEFPGLPYGHYALAVFYDSNENGRLDTNALGIPTEAYAFSNNIKAKWRSPRFGEAAFVFDRSGQLLQLELKRWEKR